MKFNGVKIQDEIARREQSVTDFANSAGLSPGSIYRAMAVASATTKTLGKIARTLGIEKPTILLQPADRAEATL